jgi:hypothetical protein
MLEGLTVSCNYGNSGVFTFNLADSASRASVHFFSPVLEAFVLRSIFLCRLT